MSDISSLTVNNTLYNLKDAHARQYGIHYVEGPSTDTTAGTWTGTIDGLTAYYDGLTVLYVPAVAGGSSATTLNINELGAITCYYSNTSALTTHYSVGTPIMLTYRNNAWRRADYNSNTTYTYVPGNSLANGGFTADSAVYRYQLLFHINADTLTPLNNNNNVVKTTKTMLTNVEIDPFGEIYYNCSTSTYTPPDLLAASYLVRTYHAVDLRYTFNITSTSNPLTAYKSIYLKTIPQSNGSVKLATGIPIVQDLPVSNDGYWYIYLGRAYSTYQMRLDPHHPVYFHDGTGIKQILRQDAVTTTTTAGLFTPAEKTKLAGIEAGATALPSVSASDNGKVLSVSSGAWGVSSVITNLYRQFWNSVSSISLTLDDDGKTYQVWCAGASSGTSGSIADSTYGADILVSNGQYMIRHKGSAITVTESSGTLTISSSAACKMAIIEL